MVRYGMEYGVRIALLCSAGFGFAFFPFFVPLVFPSLLFFRYDGDELE